MSDLPKPGPPLAPLLEAGLLLCPECGGAGSLTDADDRLQCTACAHEIPIVLGVPDFFEGYATARDDHGAEPAVVDPAVIEEIAEILDLPDTDDVRATIRGALQAAERSTTSPAITAEIREVHARFVGGEVEEPALPAVANISPTAVVERHYLPPGFVAGERRFVNVRLTNRGTDPWSSRTSPVSVTAGGRFHRQRFGRHRTLASTYTPFPIDIDPGRSITLPIEVVAPDKPGRYQVELGLVRHPDGFVTDSAVRLDVEVVRDDRHPATRPVPETVRQRAGVPDYGEDHRIANEMVDVALDRFWPDTDRRIVELGGSTHPQSWNHARSTLVNLDISAPTLQLGVLFDRHHERSIVHLCADAMSSPLTPGSWHAVTMFATLHHFAEPERLLAAAARLLLPGGFVAVMCEPTGTTLAHPAGIRDLLGGINEQTFSVDEYLWMAEQAGLQVVEGVDDGGSLKAILRHRG